MSDTKRPGGASWVMCATGAVMTAAAGCVCHRRPPFVRFLARVLLIAMFATATAAVMWAGLAFTGQLALPR